MTATAARTLEIARTRGELASGRDLLTGCVVLVPTMGALHEGHRELVRAAAAAGDRVIVSIFVNPTQFGPGEDLDRYPRTLEADLAMCAEEGVALAFVPSVEEMYGAATGVTVDGGELATTLEGASRPRHLNGVLTVVAKLFGLTRPHIALFGEKDYQQLILIERMSRELALGVDVRGIQTVREPDGMALSSRNRYLDVGERETAGTLSTALRAGMSMGGNGSAAVLTAARKILRCQPAIQVDYLELAAPDLGPAPDSGPARLLVAARVGRTRLIDNVPILLSGSETPDNEGAS